MAELGFTMYPKDWWTSDTFFEFNETERYIFLECMFFMYQNDGYLKLTRPQIESRLRIKITDEAWTKIIFKFIHTENGYTLLSVNKRLKRIVANRKNGGKGGRPPKTQKTQIENPKNNPKKPTLESKVNKSKREIEIIIPTLPEFLKYCEEKSEGKNLKFAAKKKYEAWTEGGWKDGNGNLIKNWKAKLLQTIPYLKEETFNTKQLSEEERNRQWVNSL